MILSAEEMSVRKFGKLRMKDPKMITSGSGKKEVWICDCGKEKSVVIARVFSGYTTSCGRCNEIHINNDRKFRKLRIKFPKAVLSGSNKKEIWICDCGREVLVSIKNIVSGHITNCGRCNEISAEEMASRKFGKLRMKDPKTTLPGSNKKEIWICDCGNEKLINIYDVISGNIKSCCDCFNIVYDQYLKNKDALRSLKCPIKSEDFPVNSLIPLETIEKEIKPFRCQCVLCGKVYFPRLNDIKQGKSLTCGCGFYRVSSGQKDISLFIESLGFSTELEYKVNRLSYDIYVPEKNLLIEYDGTYWHKSEKSKERDQRKKQNAVCHRYDFFRISEEEWVKNRKKAENQLKSILINT